MEFNKRLHMKGVELMEIDIYTKLIENRKDRGYLSW